MAKRISATEVARRFSELLGTVKFRGAHYIILRGGKPVASLGPVAAGSHERTLADLREILRRIPSLGDEASAFERDLRKLAKRQPRLPSGSPWE